MGRYWRGLLGAASSWTLALPAVAAVAQTGPLSNQAFETGHILVMSALA